MLLLYVRHKQWACMQVLSYHTLTLTQTGPQTEKNSNIFGVIENHGIFGFFVVVASSSVIFHWNRLNHSIPCFNDTGLGGIISVLSFWISRARLSQCSLQLVKVQSYSEVKYSEIKLSIRKPVNRHICSLSCTVCECAATRHGGVEWEKAYRHLGEVNTKRRKKFGFVQAKWRITGVMPVVAKTRKENNTRYFLIQF